MITLSAVIKLRERKKGEKLIGQIYVNATIFSSNKLSNLCFSQWLEAFLSRRLDPGPDGWDERFSILDGVAVIHQDRALIRDTDRSSVVPHRGLLVRGSYQEPGTHAGANDAWPTNSTAPPVRRVRKLDPITPSPYLLNCWLHKIFFSDLGYVKHIQVVSILTVKYDFWIMLSRN